MQLTSNAFQQNEMIPPLHTCDGAGTSPAFAIGGVPEAAQSLVLIMEDPDVSRAIREDGMWDHWLIWNIDPATAAIPEGTDPAGVHGTTTSNTTAYVPPCPPDAEHRYIFRLYALDSLLELAEGASKAELLAAMEGHIIERAELTGRYNRQ
ncbi:MAG: YbhB/YbcL family Raf kinase inhibitor-like protein [Candidatus Kerfeldbacteria bacterium]